MNNSKISTAFNSFFDLHNEQDIRESIVIVKTPDRNGGSSHISELVHKAESQIRDEYIQKSRAIHKDIDLSISTMDDDLPFMTVDVTPQTLEILADNDNVVAIIPNQVVNSISPLHSIQTEPTNEEKANGATWGLQYLNIPPIWQTTKGKGIKVGVIDTGVYANHAALRDTVKGFAFIDPVGRPVTGSVPFDTGEHGTHVCGTIAGNSINGINVGVAPEAELYVAAVNLGTRFTTITTILRAMTWLAGQGVRLINMSFGIPQFDTHLPRLFNHLIDRYDLICVAAIGNNGLGHISQPGSLSKILGVGSMELQENAPISSTFSGGASIQAGTKVLMTKPDVVAPGGSVYSSVPSKDGKLLNGTSMAAPHVTGLCALLLSSRLDINISGQQIIKILRDTSVHIDNSSRPDNYHGHGTIQPVRALEAVLNL